MTATERLRTYDRLPPPRSEVEQEGRDWMLVRIHRAAHGEWFIEGCPVCAREDAEDAGDEMVDCE